MSSRSRSPSGRRRSHEYLRNCEISGNHRAAGRFGTTPQEAVTALMQQLPADAFSPITIWPYNLGDAYFSDAQQAGLQELKGHREALLPREYAEIEGLVDASLEAIISRAGAFKTTG